MTTPYYIQIAPLAYKQILALAAIQQKIILKLIEALSINPRPPGAKKIEGLMGLYCEYINELRVIYKIEEHTILILVVK